MLLVRVELRINEACNVVFVGVAEASDCADVFAGTASYVGRAGECAVVAGAFAETVEPFRAVGLCACPFAYDGPFVCAG